MRWASDAVIRRVDPSYQSQFAPRQIRCGLAEAGIAQTSEEYYESAAVTARTLQEMLTEITSNPRNGRSAQVLLEKPGHQRRARSVGSGAGMARSAASWS